MPSLPVRALGHGIGAQWCLGFKTSQPSKWICLGLNRNEHMIKRWWCGSWLRFHSSKIRTCKHPVGTDWAHIIPPAFTSSSPYCAKKLFFPHSDKGIQVCWLPNRKGMLFPEVDNRKLPPKAKGFAVLQVWFGKAEPFAIWPKSKTEQGTGNNHSRGGRSHDNLLELNGSGNFTSFLLNGESDVWRTRHPKHVYF